MSAIELSSLSKFYGNQRGIDGVSFAVAISLTPSLWQRKKPLGWDIFHPTIT